MRLGQDVIYNNGSYGDAAVQEAAKIVAIVGNRVNLVHWSASGIQGTRHDVERSDLGAAGCWSPVQKQKQEQKK